MNDVTHEPLELHDEHVNVWEEHTGRRAADANASAHVPTSTEVLEAMYEKHGPIHPGSYDQESAMRRAAPRYVHHPPHDAKVKADVALDDFYAYMPMHSYVFVPTRELWPASSVDGRIKPWPTSANGQPIRPSAWLDANKPVEQMTWQPGEPMIIKDKVLQVAGWIPHRGATVFNLYRGPAPIDGDPGRAGLWLDHVHKVYPDDAEHIVGWLAHRVQQPGEKINHALVLGGMQGIGKDTLLEPVKTGIGPWNWQEINPAQMLGRFNAWAKAVIVRVSEARDLGDVDRFAFYDHCKVYLAAPPDVLRVDEKHLREHYVANVLGVIITTNHAGDGLYLPADDRRHYVAWSNRTKADFPAGYWPALYRWYRQEGGIGHVVAYLREQYLSGTDWQAPPIQTPAFWNFVASGEAPESGELRDVIDAMGNPEAFTLQQLTNQARASGMDALAEEFADRKIRRSIPHRMERVGYVPARNQDADDGLFKVNGRRQVVYALRSLPANEQGRAARKIG